MRSNLYDFPAKLVHETEKAWLLDVGLDKSVWIPKEAGEFDGETLTIPEGLAIEKGMENLV